MKILKFQPGVKSPGQTIATCQRNISQHCWAQHVAWVWPPCCDMLRLVGCCWLKFENGQNWPKNTQHVATHRNTVAKRTQHVVPNNVAICCIDMLLSFGRGLTGVEFHVLPCVLVCFLVEFDLLFAFSVLSLDCVYLCSRTRSPMLFDVNRGNSCTWLHLLT